MKVILEVPDTCVGITVTTLWCEDDFVKVNCESLRIDELEKIGETNE